MRRGWRGKREKKEKRDGNTEVTERGMAYETEIKLRIEDVRALRRVLKRMGAQLVGPGSGRVHEMNLIFDTPEGGLAKHGQLLRIRRETPESGKRGKAGKSAPRVMLTFKSPPEELAMGE